MLGHHGTCERGSLLRLSLAEVRLPADECLCDDAQEHVRDLCKIYVCVNAECSAANIHVRTQIRIEFGQIKIFNYISHAKCAYLRVVVVAPGANVHHGEQEDDAEEDVERDDDAIYDEHEVLRRHRANCHATKSSARDGAKDDVCEIM